MRNIKEKVKNLASAIDLKTQHSAINKLLLCVVDLLRHREIVSHKCGHVVTPPPSHTTSRLHRRTLHHPPHCITALPATVARFAQVTLSLCALPTVQ
ncbi:hypothetical protein SESBI_08233 [Sesbania bispinosa]|nr:hypothetical protein SESBI_08233 [Sesbania bispinosa]